MTNLLLLCYEFFLTGLFTVGGGLATIPFLIDMANQYGWFTLDTLSTMIAVSESTPGPMGVNMATFVGYNVAGIPGAITTTLSLVAPSIIIICIIAKYFQKFKNAKLVQQVLAGLKPAVIAFIVSACLSMFLTTLFHSEALSTFDFMNFFRWQEILLLMVLLFLHHKFPKLHPIYYIVGSAIVGIIFAL